jgi:predicted regulator of Ras-like GTPase activity (Roadblock/LC7/MglB family)
MYKLSFKLSKLGVIAPIIFAGAAIVLPQQPMLGGGNSFHISVLFAALFGVALIGSLILYDRASKVQKYQAFLTIFALSSFYGVLGNLFYNFWKWQPGMMVEFSWAQLIIMNLGGIGTTFALFKLEPFDNFASGGLERLQKAKGGESGPQEPVTAAPSGIQSAESAEDFMKSKGSLMRGNLTSSKTDMQAAVPPQEAVMTRKSGPSSLESAQAIMTPPVEIDLDASDEMLSGPLNPSPTAPAARTGAGAPAGPADAKATNNTSNRLQAQKRRNTSTFTKLQALSASGTGSLKPTPVQDSTGGGDLRSLLDRLDSEPEETDYETLPKPEEIRIAVLFSEVADKPKAGDQARPQPAASKPQPLAQPARPAQKDAPARPTTTQSTPARPQPGTAPGANQPAASDSKPVVGGLAAKMAEKKAPPAPAAGSPGLASLLDRAEALADSDEDVKPEVPAAQEFDAAPAAKAPPAQEAARKTGGDEAGLLSKRFMELSEDDDEEPTSVAAEAPTEAAEPAEEPVEEHEEDEKLFAENVDEEIDDIFSSLAPAESQKEVSHDEETLEEQSVQVEEELSPAAPAEAEEEAAPEPQVEEEPEAEAEPAEEEEGERETLFAENVDGDVDDLFSNLAPAEAQLNVGDVPLRTKDEEAPEEEEEAAPAAEEIDQDATGDFTGHKVEEVEPSGDQAEEEGDGETLFALGDSDVDDIFAGLAGDQLDVNAETLKKVKEGEAPEPQIPTSLVETGDRIPVISAESKSAKQTGDMPALTKEQAAKVKDDIAKEAAADDEESEEEESVEKEAAPMSPEKAKLKKELKEFGTLSSRSATAPKATGDSVGTMKTIGKLLIDNQAIENIIKAGEQRKLGQNLSTARIISSARGQGIMELLHKIDLYEGVVGSIIVGHDGLVMASTLKEGWDKDIMGALSTALLSTSNLTTKKLEIGKLRQMVMLTRSGNQDKTTILTDVDVGILAVFVEETDISKIDGMLDTIHKTIHG